MIRKNSTRLFLPLILQLGILTEIDAQPLPCADKSVVAGAIRTMEDVQAFVQCAYEYAQEMGFEEARRAFHEDTRWRSGAIYVVVTDIATDPAVSRAIVFPPVAEQEGEEWGPLVDLFGHDYSVELHRIVKGHGEGWLYYSTTNPATGIQDPKASYFKSIDWDGTPAAIGAGIYRPDLPSTCRPEDVNAMDLSDDPSMEKLQQFVRCAALELEAGGFFASITLSGDPRWTHKSVYVFGLDRNGNTLFSGDSSQEEVDLAGSELTSLSDRDDLSVANAFGETFLYYNALNPATQTERRKVFFAKRVVSYGLPMLIGSGYFLDQAGEGGTATLRYWQAPTILNPYLSRGTKEAEGASLVIEPLAEYNPDGELVPVLADKVPTLANGGVSADRTRITWTLREGVVWSDGTPCTAEDVVFTWRYCTAPDAGCVHAAKFANVSSVDAVDDRTVTITFDGPTSFPFSPFVTYNGPILQAAQFADCLGASAAGCTEANQQPIGTGPYVVNDFSSNESVRYEFNPLYRGVEYGVPYFGEVMLQGGGDATAAARAVLQLNEADYAWNLQVEPDVLETLAEGGGGSIVTGFATAVERLMLNQTNPDPSLGELRSEYAGGTNPHPFLSDPVVGRALSLAIDRDTLVRVGYGPLAGRSTCNLWPYPPGQASTNNDECLVQNLDLAREILDGAGIVDSDGDGVRERNGVPLKILFQTSTNAVRQTTQEHIKGWWAEIGVETELKDVVASVFFGGDPASPDTVGKFYADVQMYTNGSSFVDPEGYLGAWVTSEIAGASNSFRGGNVQRFQSDEYDRVHAELQRTVDQERRAQLTIALNDMLVQSYSIIPLIHRGYVSAHSNEIEGVRLNAWDSELWNFETWTRRK
ncbi:MAG: ABC transporter substrate-binding protein [Candidatus Aminicenantes bacterium]|nr:ABC transporter substrate-binding protein [Candidatus Aminicenantes bacterium]